MNIFKKINRNAFNEKLIHRYLFERYYFGNSKQRNALLPERLRGSEINLIVPEDAKAEHGYRADLTIYFKNKTNADNGIPVEVKWYADQFCKKNQIDYINNNEGFLIVLGDVKSKEIEGVDIVNIDHDDFSDWIAENISRLSRESLIYQAGSRKLSDINQYWVVWLKGGMNGPALKHFDKMLADKKKTNPFWAFRQNPKALPYILDMQRGDKIMFIFGKSRNMAQPKNPNEKVQIARYYICDIIEPYYMALKGDRGQFFETDTAGREYVEVNNRKWPHFIDFKIVKKFQAKELIEFGKQGEFAEIFSNSFNHGGGTPYPATRQQFYKLKDILSKLTTIK